MWGALRMRTFRRSQRSIASPMKRTKARASEKQRTLERHFGARPPTKNRLLNTIYWALRRCQYWLCFYDDEVEVDVEDLLSNPFNTHPPGLEQLVQLTGFNRKWLMFMYRNFKQRCANGRMTESQWRILFRSLFPHANDSAFVDRMYQAIIRNKPQQQITFEDLIIFLWELTEAGRQSELANAHINASSRAQFVFALMDVEGKGKIDEETFRNYTRSIFALTASHHFCDTSAIGLPAGSIYRSKSADDDLKPLSPMIARFAANRFREIDADGDGWISVKDIERELDYAKDAVALKSMSDIEEPTTSN
ncbi:unnamed protein product [Caenorhabditis bovis]|uniref:EF-hand domain-containing protein n=1 Tax=Caenorhabditis bovis TaxID=2654633 RepID=A0A8S1F3U4_9PELO|nr:unnamed protein product [Caenorhabditis bovis]